MLNLPPACSARRSKFVRPLPVKLPVSRSRIPRPLSPTSMHKSSSTLTANRQRGRLRVSDGIADRFAHNCLGVIGQRPSTTDSGPTNWS